MQKSSNFKKHKALYLRLFEMKLPLAIIAKAMDISKSTVEKYYEDCGKKESEIRQRNSPANTQWNLFGAYTSFIADPLMYKTSTAGTRHNLLSIIEKELDIRELHLIIMAHLRFAQSLVLVSFTDDVSAEQRKFINAIYSVKYRKDETYEKKPTMERVREIANEYMVNLHTDKIPFPSKKEFANREVFYAKLTESLRIHAKPLTGPLVTKQLVALIRENLSRGNEKDFRVGQAIEHFYHLGWFAVNNQWQMVTKDSTKNAFKQTALERCTRLLSLFKQQTDEWILAMEREENLRKEFEKLQVQLAQNKNEYMNELGKLKAVNAELVARKSISAEELTKIETVADTDENGVTSKGISYKLLMTPIHDIDLSVRAFNCLRAGRLDYLWAIAAYPSKELKKFRNIGRVTGIEIEAMLIEKGLSFDTEFTPGEIELLKNITYVRYGEKIPWSW